ncbi:MAG: YdcF family protein [Robiginitomaculum sp.]|nr:YdcF family protein [Robiginitomaculum sp.]
MSKSAKNKSARPAKGKTPIRSALFKLFKFLFSFGVTLLVSGFVLFVFHISTAKPPAILPKVDGIVVLTGADGSRLMVGADLLQNGHGERLLISGVNRKIKPAQIQNLLSLEAAKFICCVDLDYEAENTYGNAQETANWARALGYEKILLVTSSYHMPRAKMEITSAMGGVAIIAYPVATEHSDNTPWWGGWAKTKLLMREYGKLLVSFAREPGKRPLRKTPQTHKQE